MRNRNLAQHFFALDEERSRIDIGWPLLVVLSLAAIVGWTLYAPRPEVLAYALSALCFVGVVQFILGMFAASRISMLLVSLTAFAVFGSYDAKQLAALSAFLAVVALAQIYLVAKGKLTGAVVAIAVGLLAAGEGRFAGLALVIFSLLLAGRMAWHLVFEKMPKKIWLLFSVKAVVMILLAIGIVVSLGSDYTFPWASTRPLAWPEIHWLVWLVAGLFALRGLWGTLLLRTRRSPADRGFRLFCFLFGLAIVGFVAVLREYGERVLLPDVIDLLKLLGLYSYSPEVLAVAIVAAMLLVSAGIDRSLYRDVRHRIVSD